VSELLTNHLIHKVPIYRKVLPKQTPIAKWCPRYLNDKSIALTVVPSGVLVFALAGPSGMHPFVLSLLSLWLSQGTSLRWVRLMGTSTSGLCTCFLQKWNGLDLVTKQKSELRDGCMKPRLTIHEYPVKSIQKLISQLVNRKQRCWMLCVTPWTWCW
jgi:hypothetical protein